MDLGLNIGYDQTKAFGQVNGKMRRVVFASVVGSPDRAHFSLDASTGITLFEPEHVLIGEEAIIQSRFINRREDRDWINSAAWYNLMLAALSEITTGTPEATIVAGLPVAFYEADKDILKNKLQGVHKFTREGRKQQTINVPRSVTVPEPFGTLFDCLWNNEGKVAAPEIATGNIGIVDFGGKTTNLLSVSRMKEIGRKTASVNVGGWDMVRAVRRWLNNECPKLNLRDHEIRQSIITKSVRYYGKPVDISEIVTSTSHDLIEQVIAQATQLWNGAANLDAVLITGGGALLLGDQILAHPNFPHARIVDDPVMANARGFWKYARYLRGR